MDFCLPLLLLLTRTALTQSEENVVLFTTSSRPKRIYQGLESVPLKTCCTRWKAIMKLGLQKKATYVLLGNIGRQAL